MNKRISDLLDGYEDGSVELSGETPLSSARIKELTMKRAKGIKRNPWHRAPLRVLAAAAAAAALTMTAFAAARILGAGDLMAGLFEGWGGKPLSVTQVETLNGMGHLFDGSEQFSVTSGGATITPVSALADEDCYYLHLRVEAPEGTVLPDLDWDTQGHYVLYGEEEEGFLRLGVAYSSWEEMDETYYGRGCALFDPGIVRLTGFGYGCETLPDADPTDNVKEIVLTICSAAFQSIRYNDGRDKQLILGGLWVEHFDQDLDKWTYTQVFSGEFKLDIGGHFESRVAAIDCAGAEWSDPESGQVNRMDMMKLSPLGIKFQFHSNVREENGRVKPQFPGDVRIVMKDGSEVSFAQGNAIYVTKEHRERSDPYFQVTAGMLTREPEWALGSYAAFSAPIDLAQVDYVQFGEDDIYPIRTN